MAQVEVEWSRLYENEGTADEEGRFTGVAVRADGGAYAAAVSVPSARPRFLMYDADGQRIWSRLFGPSSCTYSQVLVGAAGEALFVGERSPATVAHTLEVVCLSSTGALNWSRSFGIVAQAPERAIAALDGAGNLALASSSSLSSQTRFAAVSAAGTLLFEHTLDLVVNADESVSALELAPDGDAFLALRSGTGCTLARVDTSGQVLWSHALAGSGPGDLSVRGLRLAGDGTLVSLEHETSPTAAPRLRWRRFGPDGSALGSSELELAQPLALRAFERASDGGLWCAGELASAPPRLFVARFDPRGGPASSCTWPVPLDLTAIGRTTLVPASAGQVWVTANVWSSPTHSTRHGAALLFGPDPGAAPASGTLGLRALFGDDVELKEIGATAASHTGRLLVAGRSEAFTGPYFHFEPIAWLAQLDASSTPRVSCAGQTDSAGCTPTLVVSGLPQAGAAGNFVVSCVDVPPQRSGLLVHGTTGPASTPLGGGTLCVAGPLHRSPTLGTGAGSHPCGGTLRLDWSAYASGTLGGSLAPGASAAGTEVHVQGWIREPSSSSGARLSAALRWVVLP